MAGAATAIKPKEATRPRSRAGTASAARQKIQRKPKSEFDEAEDRKSSLLAGTVQAKPMVQRMTTADAELEEKRKLSDAGKGPRVQRSGFISSVDDPSEREADRVADAVMSSPAPMVGRATASIHRKEDGSAGDSGSPDKEVEARIRAAAVGGKPLSRKTRALLEPRFGTDFSAVRVHDDAQSAKLATRIGARAFAFGNHIFFNEGQYQPATAAGQHLLAHELTHTIQQSATVQRKETGPVAGARVSESTGPQASRLGVSDALEYFAEAAYAIPGYRMFTILIGINPINMHEVERSAANILRAIVEFLPGGVLITTVLDQFGVFEEVGAWIEEQLDTLGISGSAIKTAIDEFLDSLGWRDIFDLGDVWHRAKRIFTDPIDRIITFVGSLFGKVLEFVQKAVLAPIAALVAETEGYTLLTQILGFDPITGDPVERSAEAIIGGLLTLAGQEELWQNIQEANAIERIWEWFQGALEGLIALVSGIPDRFVEALQTIEITEFLDLPAAILKVLGVFGSIVIDFGAWILNTVFTLMTIIIDVVAPGLMGYLQKAGKAFDTIVNDPIAFVGNLVAAARRGFELFIENFVPNLRSALIQWLTGALAGAAIHIPQSFSLQEILKFILSVLGVTWENVRPKLVRVMGETAVAGLEAGFELVRTLVTEGPAAAWQQLVEMIGNLRDMVIEQIIDFVTNRVIEQAVVKLLSFLNPAGALIQAIIATYNTVMFFVERLSQMAQVAAAFIDSIADIASGKIEGAAAKVEQTMVGLLSLAISFLARLVGLGNVGQAVTALLDRLRRPIDQAIDRLIAWIVTQARRFAGAVRSGVAAVVNWWRTRKEFRTADGEEHALFFAGRGRDAALMMASSPKSFAQVLADDQNGLTDEQRAILREKYAQLQDRIAQRAPGDADGEAGDQAAFQEEIAGKVNELAQNLARWLGHTANVPASTVTWNTRDGSRAASITAQPLTVNPGNTTGGAATGDRRHAIGFNQLAAWEVKKQTFRNDGEKEVMVSEFVAAHLLNHRLHGPYTERWNIALAHDGLNKSMSPIEDKAVTWLREDPSGQRRLAYTVEIDYHDNALPDADIMNQDEPTLSDIRQTVGYFTAKKAKVTTKGWDGTGYTAPVQGASGEATGQRIPTSKVIAKPLDEQVYAKLKRHRKRTGETRTTGSGVFRETTITNIADFARSMQRGSNLVGRAFQTLMAASKIMKVGRVYYVKD